MTCRSDFPLAEAGAARLALLLLLPLGASLHGQVAVVNGASFRGEQPVTAGSWAAAFPLPAGRAFAGIGAAATAGGFPLPKTLGGVTVRIDGLEAPLYDVRPSQVTFLIPGAVQPGLRPVQIAAAGGATITGTVRVISSAPGLFIKDTAVPPRAAVRNQDGTTENNASSPALRGEVISLYGTGPGALSTAVEDGAPPGFRPLATTRSAPQVFIGGVEATVQFSGLNPDVPGLWQINVVVPPLAFLSGRVPVRVFVDGVDSNEVAIFVQ